MEAAAGQVGLAAVLGGNRLVCHVSRSVLSNEWMGSFREENYSGGSWAD